MAGTTTEDLEEENSKTQNWALRMMVSKLQIWNLTNLPGAWVNDRKEGTGIVFYKNGDSYMGPWKADMRNGEGVFTRVSLCSPSY